MGRPLVLVRRLLLVLVSALGVVFRVPGGERIVVHVLRQQVQVVSFRPVRMEPHDQAAERGASDQNWQQEQEEGEERPPGA